MKHTAFAAFLGVMLQVTAAFAQGQGGGSPVYQNWFPVGTPATLSVSNVTANVALPTGGLTARVCNTGATDAYVVLGTANTVVATTTAGSFLASGKCQPFNLLPFATRYTYIAAITASSTTTIRVESGLGSPIASDAAGASAPPSGPAGGDLAGTYPNPTVAKASSGFALPSSALTFSGNITGAAIFGTNGIKVKTTSGTLSDTTSTGTVAANYNNLFGGNTQTATSATTITNNYGSYFTAPTCSTNVTCTNNYALGADSLNVSGLVAGGTFTVTSATVPATAGIYLSSANTMGLAASGAKQFSVQSGGIFANGTNGAAVSAATTSATVPGFIVKWSDLTTGWGAQANGNISGIIGGAETVRFVSTGLQLGPNILQGASTVGGTADLGLGRDSVLGAGNLDLGNGSANDKSGTLNAAKVALGGCTIGTDNMCITGAFTASGNVTGNGIVSTSGNIQSAASFVALSDAAQLRLGVSQDARLIRIGPASLAFGLPDAAAPSAQSIGVQNVVAGTSNTIGQPWSLNGSQSTGTAAGGSVLIKTSPADVTHTVNTFTGSASPYTIGFTAGNITTYPIGTVMTVSGCTTATLNGTYTVTASSSGSVTATTSATGTGSPTTCLIVGNTSQNPAVTTLKIDPAGNSTAQLLFNPNSGNGMGFGSVNGGSQLLVFSNNSGIAGSNTQTAAFRGGSYTGVSNYIYGWTNNTSDASTTVDTGLSRDVAGVIDAGTGAQGSSAGSLKFASYIAGGTAPVGSGTCTRGTQTGGLTAGSIVLTCTAQTLILTFTTTAPTGWMCEAIDQTTVADTMKQTSNTTTSCTLTGTTAASDVVIYQARAY